MECLTISSSIFAMCFPDLRNSIRLILAFYILSVHLSGCDRMSTEPSVIGYKRLVNGDCCSSLQLFQRVDAVQIKAPEFPFNPSAGDLNVFIKMGTHDIAHQSFGDGNCPCLVIFVKQPDLIFAL